MTVRIKKIGGGEQLPIPILGGEQPPIPILSLGEK